jgi:hypothetical protein
MPARTIVEIGAVVVVVALGIMLLPDFLRYMKIRAM